MKVVGRALLLGLSGVELGVHATTAGATAKASLPSVSSADPGRARWNLGSEEEVQPDKRRDVSVTACGCRGSLLCDVVPRGVTSMTTRSSLRVRGGAVMSDPYNARMQVMITRNMRKVLIDELDYLADEVDDMDPQIAAVVIEKSLPRPRAGMPVAWRRSIRRTGSSSNPVRLLTGAALRAMRAVVNGVVAVAGFPFAAAGKGIGTMAGGPKGLAVLMVLGLGLMAVIVTPASGRGLNDTSPVGTGLRMLSENLAAAKALLPSRGDGDGSARSRTGAGRKAGGAASDGGGRRAAGPAAITRGAATKTGRRRFGARGSPQEAHSNDDPEPSPEEEDRPDASAAKRKMSFFGTRHGVEGSWRGRDGDNKRRSRRRDGRGGRSSSVRPSHEGDGQGRREFGGGGGGGDRSSTSGGESIAEAKTENDISSRRDGDAAFRRRGTSPHRSKNAKKSFGGKGMAGRDGSLAGTGSPESGLSGDTRPENGAMEGEQGERDLDGGTRRGREAMDGEDGGVAFLDAPVGLNTGGAVWFDDLPPVPPAPETIGVLDEEDKEALWNEPYRLRRGQRPVPEHIPSEEEMDAWDTNARASDSLLDRAIDRVFGLLLGGGGEKDGSD